MNKVLFSVLAVLWPKHGIKCMLKSICAGIKWVLSGGLLFVCLLFSFASFAKTVTVTAAQWPGYTHVDGSGLYFQILREALASENIQLNIRTSNWKRAKHMFQANRADILICDYRAVDTRRLWPRWHLDYDQPILLFSQQPIKDLQQLQDQPVGWLLGYDFDRYLPVSVRSYEVATDKEGFTLLQHGRLSAFISYQMHLPARMQSRFHSMELAAAQPMYPVFHNDFNGRNLARAFDAGMQRLYQSGRLAALFNNPQLYQHARFDKVSQPTATHQR
jgi:ABC-type amino acid transport substrate-binding protein